jgi:hypothetical protein
MPRLRSLLPALPLVLLLAGCGGGGSGGGGGNNIVPLPVVDSHLVVTVVGTSRDMKILEDQQFVGVVTNTKTGVVTSDVTWSINEGVTGGITNVAGHYIAPPLFGVFHVTATSVTDPTKSGTFAVNVHPLVVVSSVGAKLTATVTGAANTDVDWLAPAGCGTVAKSFSGVNDALFTPPAGHGSCLITARSIADPGGVGTITVNF